MSFRVTPHRQYELGRLRAQQKFASSADLQSAISSGVRVRRPSDDPNGIKVILRQKSVVEQVDSQLTSLGQARSSLNQVNSQLLDAQELVVRARSLAVEGRQTFDQTERDALAGEMDLILRQVESIANAKADGQYIFGGGTTGAPPYEGIADGTTTYAGSDSAAPVTIGGTGGIRVLYSGRDVFQPTASGNLVILGQTGVQPGAGTSSGSTASTLTVTHTLTTYAAGSGVSAGASSVAGDTVIGQAGTHTLTINDTSGTGAAGTVSLNGGPAVAFASSDTDLKVTGPAGEVIYLNTSSISAGFNGDVDITATGTISLDGGATAVAIDYSSNQTLTNDSLGVVQHFDTTGVTRAGEAPVEFADNPDVFATLRALRDDLRNTRGLSNSELDDAFNRRIGDLDLAQDHLLGVIGEQAVSLTQLQSIQTRLEDLKLGAQELLGDTESTDLPSAILKLQEEQNLLQFTLSSLVTLTNTTVLDFLR